MQVYDRVIRYENRNTLLVLTLGGGVAILVEALLKIIRELIIGKISLKTEAGIRTGIIGKIVKSKDGESRRDEIDLRESLSILTEAKKIRVEKFFKLFSDGPFLLLYVVILYYLHPGVCFFNLGVLGITFIIVQSMLYFYIEESKKIKAHSSRNNLLQSSMKNVVEVKNLGFEKKVVRILEGALLNQVFEDHSEKNSKSLVVNLSKNLSLVNLLGTTLLGAYFVNNSELTIGGLTACVLVSGRVVSPFFAIMNYFQDFYENRKDLTEVKEKISKFEVEESQGQKIRGQRPLEVSLKNIDIKLEDEIIFSKMNFVFEPGEVYCFDEFEKNEVRSLFNYILNFGKEGEGKIEVNSIDIRNVEPKSLYDGLYHLSLKNDFFLGTIVENISLFDTRRSHSELCASIVGLDSYVNELKEGYDSKLDPDNLDNISSTILLRIKLARLLYQRPRLIFVDDIFNNMTESLLEVFVEIVQNLRGESTILINKEPSKFPFESYSLQKTNEKLRIVA